MIIIRILPEEDRWTVVLEDGSSYVVWKEDVMKMEMEVYDQFLRFLQVITKTMYATDQELKDHYFNKRLL